MLSACCMNGVSDPTAPAPCWGVQPGISEQAPSLSLLQLQTPSFLSVLCQLALLPPFLASLGTQHRCPMSPWTGSLPQMADVGALWSYQEARELMVYGERAGTLEELCTQLISEEARGL